MNFTMPSQFPDSDFRSFGIAATKFFPGLLSDEVLYDPLEKRRHFDWSWQAVRYRYRSCVECSAEFKALLDNPSQAWLSGWGDEELTYKLERCVYVFFVSALSVFDSFALCLYFLGNAIQASAFSDVANPRKITRFSTQKAMSTAFPNEAITGLLSGLPQDARFTTLEAIRNLLAHRLSGRRSVRSSGTLQEDGSYTTDFHEETWHIPGVPGRLNFDRELLERHLADITSLVTSLVATARAFAEAHQPVKAQP
ncbi:MAG TPA: hypothetical protein VFN26_14125 [Candidatus Acidoferrum sp.]|nr:hypothetical protein [Candidatus Acidoferrum sp.]